MQRARTPKSSLRIPFLVSHHNAVCSIVRKFPNTFLQPPPGEDHHARSISHIDMAPLHYIVIPISYNNMYQNKNMQLDNHNIFCKFQKVDIKNKELRKQKLKFFLGKYKN